VSCTDRSLAKLGRERIDLTQFHNWTDAWLGNDEWKEAVAALKRDGKIGAFGVSINDHEPASALQLVASGLVDTVQVIFNIFDQSPLERLFPLCVEHGVGVIVRVPFDEGSLTGAFTPDTRFTGDDFRARYFRGERLPDTLRRVEALKTLLDPSTPTLPELALKFILGHSAVSTVIPGMRKLKNVAANTAVSSSAPLPAGRLAALRAHAWPRNFYL
jgi:aryl-alcohol dehydrogenase-like predicted oxidoreductase